MMDSENQVRYFEGEGDKEFALQSMRKYLSTKQELDKFLELLIAPFIQDKRLRILDACCGIGHIIYYLRQISPESRFVGIDKTPYLVEEANKLCGGQNTEFKLWDVYQLSEIYEKEFDVSICWKTLSWLPSYKPLITELIKVTKEHIFISSLFYDGDIDFEIKVREYQKEAGTKGFNAYYNVYSYPRFEQFCYNSGAKHVEARNFDIGIDIPPPTTQNQMGTYTLRLQDGKRLQVSGVVLMLWKVVRIDL